MKGIIFKESLIGNPAELFNKLKSDVEWDERKTASY